MKSSMIFGMWSVLALVVAGGAAVAVVRQNAIGRLRAEHETLLSQKQEAVRLAKENEGIGRLRAEVEGMQKIREENRDLPRLRNEVRQMRREADELAKLRAENQRLLEQAKSPAVPAAPPQLPDGFMPKATLVDAGLSSPEATVQTFFAAACHGDVHRMAQCTVADPANEPKGADAERMRQEMMDQMSKFPGFAIGEKKTLSPSEIELELKTAAGGVSLPMKLKLVGAEWKMEN